MYTSILKCSISSYANVNAFGMDAHVMHVRMSNTPGITVYIDIFQLTQTGFTIALHIDVSVHV